MWLGRQQPFFRVSPSPCSLRASKCPSSLPFIWPCLHLWVFLTRFSAGDQLLPLGRAASSWRRVLSPRLRESTTTTAPLTHLRRSLPGRKLTKHFFPDGKRVMGCQEGLATETEALQQPVLLLGCGGSTGAGVLPVAMCVAWP